MKQSRILHILLPLILLAGLFINPCLASPKLRIGVITPLTGSLATSGQSVRNSILLAQELFDPKKEVVFTFEDDGFLPKNSAIIAKKFIEEKQDAIIIFGTPTAFAVVPITEQAKMPLAAVTIVDRVVEDKRYAVRHFVAWQEENRRIVEEVRKRNYKRVAIVSTINDASLALRDGFLKDAGVEVVLNEEFIRDERDFRTVAARIKVLRPDAIYHLLFAPQGSVFMRTLREVGCEAPVFAAHNVEDPGEVAASQGTYEGIWYVTGDDRPGAHYLELYRKRFGSVPGMGWASAFDYAKMMIEAAQSGSAVLPYLKELKSFKGAFGTYGATSGNTFSLKAAVKHIEGSEFWFD